MAGLSTDGKNLGLQASYTAEEIIDKQIGISTNTIRDLDDTLIPDAEAKVEAIRKFCAAIDEKILRRINEINDIVDDILEVHEVRLATQDDLNDYNTSMPPGVYDEDDGKVYINVPPYSEATESYYQTNWNPYTTTNGLNYLQSNNISKWPSNIQLVKTPRLVNGNVVFNETEIDNPNAGGNRSTLTVRSIVYNYKWDIIEPCSVEYRNNPDHFLVDNSQTESQWSSDLLNATTDKDFDKFVTNTRESGTNNYDFSDALEYNGPKRLCPTGNNITDVSVLSLVGLTTDVYNEEGELKQQPLGPIGKFGTDTGSGETIIYKVDQRITGFDYNTKLDTPLTESNIILLSKESELVGIGANAEYFEIPYKYDIGAGTNFNNENYTINVIKVDEREFINGEENENWGKPFRTESGEFVRENRTFSDEFNRNTNSDYKSFMEARENHITKRSNSLEERLIPDSAGMKDQAHKLELNLWALNYARVESDKDRTDAVNGKTLLKRYKKDLTEQFEGADEVNNNELPEPKKFEDLTDDEKKSLSLTLGLGVTQTTFVTDENGDPILRSDIDQNDPNLTDEQRYVTLSDNGFNENFDDQRIKEFFKSYPSFAVTGDYVITTKGSLVIYNSVGTAKTHVGLSSATKSITRGGISTSDYAVGVVTITNSLNQPEFFRSQAIENQKRILTPPKLAGVVTSYNGFIGTEGRSWSGVYSKRFYGTLVGSALSIFTNPDNVINATGEYPVVMGFGSSETARSSSTPMISTHFTYNVDTFTLSVPNISVAGTVTYDDVTNIDSLGIITARSDLFVSGNTDLNGILTVSGDTSVGSALTVTGNTVLNGTLSVCGNTTLSSALSVSGNTAIKGTLNVSGNTTLSSALSVSGNTAIKGSLNVSGNTTLSSKLTVSGSTCLRGNLSVSGIASVGGNRVLTIADEGSGNGLDADTLDGQEGSYYLNATNINAGTLSDSRLPSTMSAKTFTGDLTIDNDANLVVGDGAANERILIKKADNNVSDHIIFYNGTTRVGEIGCEGTSWLRINQETNTNIYTPRYIRSDGGFFVDGTTKGINGDGNFIGGTIAGASDYNTLLRSNADDTATGTLTLRDVVIQAGYTLQRSDHHTGHLEGSYNNVGANSQKSNPIYTIGSNYNPNDADLNNMYGIGYSHNNASFISLTGVSGWGLYVAADGDARVYLDGSNGVISSTGNHYVNGSRVLTVADEGEGNGLDADTLDGLNSTSFLRSDTNDNTTGRLLIGGTYLNNSYNSTASTRLLFGGGDDPDNYFIGTNMENYGGNYTKLDLRWHTGIRMGAQAQYGGTRIFNNEDLSTLLFSVGKGDGNTRVESGNLYITGNVAWHAGNDGANSGLDADLLDGNHASAFQPAASELTWVDQATGNYGTIKVDDDRSITWAGYAIRDDWVFMSSGAETSGIYNDTDNEWSIIFRRNAETELYYNGVIQAETQNGYFLANNQCWSPAFYDSDATNYYVDPASTSILNYSRNNDVTVGTTAALSSKGPLGIYRSSSPYISFHDGTTARTAYFQETGGRFLFGEVDYTESVGSFKAPFFSDIDDTNFYLDPAGTGRSLRTAGYVECTYVNAGWMFDSADPTYYVDPAGPTTCFNGAGNLYVTGSIYSTSDLKFKENIEIISDAVEKIKNIRGVTFTRNDHEDTNKRYTGVIAQEVEQVLPEAVIEGTAGKTVAYGNMVGLLIEAIKEQQEMIDLQQKDINNLKHQIKNLQR